LVFDTGEGTETEIVLEQGFEEIIWTGEELNDWKMEKTE
jgi:hypothetical protein